MKLNDLLSILESCANDSEVDPEMAHVRADEALLDYVGNEKVKAAYDAVIKWYG